MKRKLHKAHDPHAVAMFKRKSGAHVKTKKALRRADKVALRKDHQGPVAELV